jgi:rhodanese-related sulfurtransferase
MKTISSLELKNRLDNGDELYILDVREPHEFAENNMGGVLLPLGKIAQLEIDDIEDWRNKEVIVHCRSGMRSMQAIMMLESAGFSNLSNLEGGIIAWDALPK